MALKQNDSLVNNICTIFVHSVIRSKPKNQELKKYISSIKQQLIIRKSASKNIAPKFLGELKWVFSEANAVSISDSVFHQNDYHQKLNTQEEEEGKLERKFNSSVSADTGESDETFFDVEGTNGILLQASRITPFNHQQTSVESRILKTKTRTNDTGNQLKADQKSFHSASKVEKFGNSDNSREKTQVGKTSSLERLMLSELEKKVNSYNWNDTDTSVEKMQSERTIFYDKFFHITTQFNYAVNSEKLQPTFSAYDLQQSQSIKRHGEYKTIGQFDNRNEKVLLFEQMELTANNTQIIEVGKIQTNLVKKIFDYLEEVLNDFSKLHDSIINWKGSKMERVFKDLATFFDQTAEANSEDWESNEDLGICYQLIKKTIDNILASEELCAFLKWEEQCFILLELCKSKIVCENILPHLLTKMLTVLTDIVETQKAENANSFKSSWIIEKLVIIFQMIENLATDYVNQCSSTKTKTDDLDKSLEESDIFFLWQSQPYIKNKSFNFQSSQGEAPHQKWLSDLEHIIKLTNNQLCLFSLSAQESLRILKQLNPDNEIEYSFTQKLKFDEDI